MPSIIFTAIVFALIVESRASDRCSNDPAYSLRVCNAIRWYLSTRSPCDSHEIEALQNRINSLRRTLRYLQQQEQQLRRETTASPSNCPGAILNGKCYFIVDQSGDASMKTFAQAREVCRSRRATLIQIHNKEIYDFVYDYVERNAYDFLQRGRNLVIGWTASSYTNRRVFLPDNRTPGYVRWSIFNPTNRTSRTAIGIAVTKNPQMKGMFNVRPALHLYPICERQIS